MTGAAPGRAQRGLERSAANQVPGGQGVGVQVMVASCDQLVELPPRPAPPSAMSRLPAMPARPAHPGPAAGRARKSPAYQPSTLSQVRALVAATPRPTGEVLPAPAAQVAREPETPPAPPTPAPVVPASEVDADGIISVLPEIETPARRPAAPSSLPGQLAVAGFWRRLLANAVDLAIVGLVLWGVGWGVARGLGVGLPVVSRVGLDDLVELAVNHRATLLAVALPAAGLLVLYFLAFHAVLGQTPGKRLLGICLVDRRGQRPGPLRLLVRLVGSVLSVATCWAGFLWLAFDRHKRGLHDHLAGTWVVVRERGQGRAISDVPGPSPEGPLAQP